MARQMLDQPAEHGSFELGAGLSSMASSLDYH
jgi:hypothetical protein